ncbi:MAG: hypothetical protein ACRC1K_26525 [Planctomycetia bacterium]
MTRQLTLNLADILERKYPSGFHVPADIDITTFLEFADDDWDQTIDLDALLAAEDQVASLWSVDDVLDRRPDLTRVQAWQVLTTARDDFAKDACHLDFLECTANGLFPVGADAKLRLKTRLDALLAAVERLPDDGLADPARFGRMAAQIDDLEKAIAAPGGRP